MAGEENLEVIIDVAENVGAGIEDDMPVPSLSSPDGMCR